MPPTEEVARDSSPGNEFILTDERRERWERRRRLRELLSSRPQVIISSDTPLHDIIGHLTSHGCRDLTHQLELSSSNPQPVSRGGFGDVYRGALSDKRQVAIKALRVPFDSDDEHDKLPKRAARELYAWSKCNHSNVLPLLGLVEFQGHIRMVSLWMENGSLPSYLDKHPDIDRCNMSVHVCNGLAYLHGTGLVHGDLKGQNVLVSDQGVPMITDFGNAVLQQGTLQFTKTNKTPDLTIQWTAPELLDDEGEQSQKADVYALGMTILETITGKVPYYQKKSIAAIIKAIVMGQIPTRPEAQIPSNSQDGDALWSLLKDCWTSEPKERPSSSDVARRMNEVTREGLMCVLDEPSGA